MVPLHAGNGSVTNLTEERTRPGPPRVIFAWLAAVNLLMAGVLVWVIFKIDHLIVYVAAAPLVVTFLLAAGTYTLALAKGSRRG